MLSEKLRERTKKNHQELEGILIPEIKAVKSKADYLKLLNLFYSYFAALESKINSGVEISRLPDYELRRKASALRQDIAALGGDLPRLAEDYELPEIKTHLQALGALYVIEGSTLGGKIITQMISGNLKGSADHALSYYSSYGEKTGEMWSRFKFFLDTEVPVQSEQEIVIAAANETFSRFKGLALKR